MRALATLPTTINRVITDRRIWTDVIASHGKVLNWWTLSQGMSFVDPVASFTAFRPRLGTVDLKVPASEASSDPQKWRAEGGYQVAYFDGTAGAAFNERDLRFSIAKPTGKKTVAVHRNVLAASRDWGLESVGVNVGIRSNPVRSATRSMHLILNGTETRLDFGAAAPVGTREIAFHTIDFDTGVLTLSGGMSAAASQTFANWAAMYAAMTTTLEFHIGEGGVGSQPFDGTIIDFLWIDGDIHATANAALRADLVSYASTVFVG